MLPCYFRRRRVVSFAVMWLFTKPIDRVLRRIIADEISLAWSKYMKFATMVVGVRLRFDGIKMKR